MSSEFIVLIVIIVTLIVVFIASFYSYKTFKKRQKEVSRLNHGNKKLLLEVNIEDKTYRLTRLCINEEGQLETNKQQFFPLKTLLKKLDSLEKNNFFMNALELILNNSNKNEIEDFIKSQFGKREKLRFKRKNLVFLTPSTFNARNSM